MSAVLAGGPIHEPYFRVSPKIWSHPFSEDARTLAVYLLTCPHRTIEGLYRLPLGYAVADLKWSRERLAEPLRELLADGFADYDETTEVVFIRQALHYQAPANPNMMRAAAVRLAMLPPTRLFAAFFEAAQRYAEPFAQRLPELLPQRFGKPPSPSPSPSPSPEEHTLDSTESCEFADFYAAYPRHVARRAAERTWGRLTASERQEALAAVERMAEAVTANGCELRFVPYPATWLNQRRFEDWRDGVPIEYQNSNGKPSAISALQRAYEMTEGEP